MMSRESLEAIGLMEACYFLHFEEIGWAVGARRRGFRLRYAPGAETLPNQRATIESGAQQSGRNYTSDCYMLRSQLALTRLLYHYSTVFAYSLFQLLRNLLSGDVRRARVQGGAITGRTFLASGGRA